VVLVHKITEESHWKFIVERFKYFQSNVKIRCCGIPISPKEEKKTNKAATVINWWETIEQQSLELSLYFNCMLNTDITDCYGAIYTHTIPWALHEKDVAKQCRNDKRLIGNQIDKTIQEMQNGQTNGR